MTRDEAIRAVVDVAEDVVANASQKAAKPGYALVPIADLQRLTDTLKIYWQKEGEEE